VLAEVERVDRIRKLELYQDDGCLEAVGSGSRIEIDHRVHLTERGPTAPRAASIPGGAVALALRRGLDGELQRATVAQLVGGQLPGVQPPKPQPPFALNSLLKIHDGYGGPRVERAPR
jgi:hypothetical protein